MSSGVITIEDIKRARTTLEPVLEKTPMVRSDALSTKTQQVYLKLECLQRTGAFNIRGAYNKIANLSDEEKSHGIIASSAGNHVHGVALAAQQFGIHAVICMPEETPYVKIEACSRYGAEVVLKGNDYDEAYEEAKRLADENKYTYIHPFEDELVIAGQGTLCLDILDSIPDVDCIVVPIGGGGLIAGVAIAAKSINPNIEIIGVQAASSAAMQESISQGHLVTLKKAVTIADEIQVRAAGTKTFSLLQTLPHKVRILAVSEDEISEAILFLLENQHVVAEGAGAVPVAAMLAGKIPSQFKKVCLLIAGGNINVTTISSIIDRGLLSSKRRIRFKAIIDDKVGQVSRLASVIGDNKGNIFNINQTRQHQGMKLGYQEIDMVVDTAGSEHSEQILQALRKEGFRIKEDSIEIWEQDLGT
ncbi:MAG: Threonine dehydratase [Streblomastix strix]|uniref:threonine ammonia-lyase n=1 Tax=Streblomastix strix TaxID=222440 RepID=A0A5J4WX42_9EUKA|nr:MAG: Threonine dehydratase [Streblomastix strix]